MTEEDRFDYARDRSHDTLELRQLDVQLFAARGSQLVLACPAVSFSRAPLRGHPTFDRHPLQRGIQRAFFNLEDIIRYPLDGIGYFIPVQLSGARQSP